MDNSIYEVDKEDYKTFIRQLDPDKMYTEEEWAEQLHITKIKSKRTDTYLCGRVGDAEHEEEHYFIFNYPEDNERIPIRPVCQIHLETREEVQAFLNALSTLQKENKND